MMTHSIKFIDNTQKPLFRNSFVIPISLTHTRRGNNTLAAQFWWMQLSVLIEKRRIFRCCIDPDCPSWIRTRIFLCFGNLCLRFSASLPWAYNFNYSTTILFYLNTWKYTWLGTYTLHHVVSVGFLSILLVSYRSSVESSHPTFS